MDSLGKLFFIFTVKMSVSTVYTMLHFNRRSNAFNGEWSPIGFKIGEPHRVIHNVAAVRADAFCGYLNPDDLEIERDIMTRKWPVVAKMWGERGNNGGKLMMFENMQIERMFTVSERNELLQRCGFSISFSAGSDPRTTITVFDPPPETYDFYYGTLGLFDPTNTIVPRLVGGEDPRKVLEGGIAVWCDRCYESHTTFKKCHRKRNY